MAGGLATGGKINIVGGEDEFARYKMPVIQGKVEGRGNGIKTRIVNCYEVGRALHRPPAYLCRFFGYELGAQTQINEPEGTYIVNGQHEFTVLSQTLEKFINGFVLCFNCKLPETEIKVDKRQVIKQVCLACGHSESVDNLHKLCTYIINNPPDSFDKAYRKKVGESAANPSNGKKAKKKNAAEEKAAKAAKKSAKKDETEEERKERKAKRKEEKAAAAAAAAAEGGGAEDDDDDDGVVWATDTSAEAMAQRLAEAESAARLLEGTKIESPVEKLMKGISEGKEPESVARRARKMYDTDAHLAIALVVEAYIKSPTNEKSSEVASKVVVAVKALLKKMAGDDDAWQQALMDRVDRMFESGVSDDGKAVKHMPFVLKALYDEELMAEEKVVHWFQSDAKNSLAQQVRDGSATFVAWLETVESEGSEEEEGEDDGEEEEGDE